jgi:Ca2+-transporting ATPase
MAVLASRGIPVDAMERAIQRLAGEQLGGTEHLHPDWPLEREYPLQSDLLVFSRLWRDTEGDLQLAAKGAPEAIADLCHLGTEQGAALLAAADGLAARGLRVLTVAHGLDGVRGPGGPAAAGCAGGDRHGAGGGGEGGDDHGRQPGDGPLDRRSGRPAGRSGALGP